MGDKNKPDVVLHTLDIGNLFQLLKNDSSIVDIFINKALEEYQLCELTTVGRLGAYAINTPESTKAHSEFYKQVLEVVSKRLNTTSRYSRYPQVSHLRRNQLLFLIVKFY